MYQSFIEKYGEEVTEYRIQSGLKKRQFNYYLEDTNPADGQEEAFSHIEKYTDEIILNGVTTGLVLIGGVGCGKTFMVSHIANSVINFIVMLQHNQYLVPHYNKQLEQSYDLVLFTNALDMFENLREHSYLIRDYKENYLLILDDLGAEKSSEWTREKLFEIIDYRYNELLPTLITTNCIPEELKEKVGDRVYDRLREMCVLVPINTKSQRETAS